MIRRLASGMLAIALVALPSTAHAVPTEGERLFREGRAAMQSADYDTACARFAESQRKEPAPGTSLNLGECEERRNRLMAARDAFMSAASAFTTADKRGYALGRAEALDKRIPKVVLRVSGASPKGVVVRAGERVVERGVELRFDPGEVTFSVEAPAARTKKQVVALKESNAVIEIELGPLDIDGPAKPTNEALVVPPRDEAPGGGNGLRTVGWVLVGVGAASLVAGGVTGIMTLGRASTVKDHCDGNLACDSEGRSAASSGQTLSLVSTITVIAGVVGLGAGGVLLFTSPGKKTASTTIGPGPGDLGLMMRRSF